MLRQRRGAGLRRRDRRRDARARRRGPQPAPGPGRDPGLASFAPETGSNAIGPHGITDAGRRIFVTNGGPTAPLREGVVVPRWVLAQENPVARRFGKVFRFRAGKGLNRDLKAIADPYALESGENPDGLVGNPLVDSNPVDVAIDRGRVVIADAGANSLLRTDPDSSLLDVLALFANRPTPNPFGGPDVPMNAVPTGVIASGSSYYVSQLTGSRSPARRRHLQGGPAQRR